MKPQRNKKRRGQAKYDWISWKQMYMDSIEMNIREFFRLEVGVKEDGFFTSGNFYRETNGWKNDKLIYLAEKQREARQAVKEKYAVDYAELYKWKSTALNAAAVMLKQGLEIQRTTQGDRIDKVKLSVKELERLIKIIKTELGEPTNINKDQFEGFEKDSDVNLQIELTKELNESIQLNLTLNENVSVQTDTFTKE